MIAALAKLDVIPSGGTWVFYDNIEQVATGLQVKKKKNFKRNMNKVTKGVHYVTDHCLSFFVQEYLYTNDLKMNGVC